MNSKEINKRLSSSECTCNLKTINQKWKEILNEKGLKQIKIIDSDVNRNIPYGDGSYVAEGAECVFTFADNDNYYYIIKIYLEPYNGTIDVSSTTDGNPSFGGTAHDEGSFSTLENACFKAKELYEEYKLRMDKYRLDKKKKDDKLADEYKDLEKIYVLETYSEKYFYKIDNLDELKKQLKKLERQYSWSVIINEYGYLADKKIDMSIFEYVDHDKFFKKECKKLREWEENTNELLWKMFINDVKGEK